MILLLKYYTRKVFDRGVKEAVLWAEKQQRLAREIESYRDGVYQ